MNKSAEHSRIKVFFALWPAEAEREALSAWQPVLQAACGGRAMGKQTLHATLVFIGQIEPHRLEALQLAAQEASGQRFRLCLETAHYWGHNHIAYAAPGSTPVPLAELVHGLEQSLIRHRFKFDQREYKPHVTLLRNARWTDAPLPTVPAVHWQVSDFALVQSAAEGYRVLARFPLCGSGG